MDLVFLCFECLEEEEEDDDEEGVEVEDEEAGLDSLNEGASERSCSELAENEELSVVKLVGSKRKEVEACAAIEGSTKPLEFGIILASGTLNTTHTRTSTLTG